MSSSAEVFDQQAVCQAPAVNSKMRFFCPDHGPGDFYLVRLTVRSKKEREYLVVATVILVLFALLVCSVFHPCRFVAKNCELF
jgi:hypothetical protein